MSVEYTDVVFIKVDVDENPDSTYIVPANNRMLLTLIYFAAAATYNVSAMPTFIFLKEGEVVDRLMGASPDRLREMIEEHK